MKTPTKLNDWELEDYISEHRPDLHSAYLSGRITLAKIRQKTKIE